MDYFGARYYEAMSAAGSAPDWAQKPEPVPYSDDPQSLNLYEYVGNNPLSKADANGHCPMCVEEALEWFAETPGSALESGIQAAAAAVGTIVATHVSEVIQANADYYSQGGGGVCGFGPTWPAHEQRVVTRGI